MDNDNSSELSMTAVVLIFFGIYFFIIALAVLLFFTLVLPKIQSANLLQSYSSTTPDNTRQGFKSLKSNITNSTELARQEKFKAGLTQVSNQWSSGNYAETIRLGTQLLSEAVTAGEKASVHYWLGLGYYRQSDYITAESEEKTALSLWPTYAAPYATLSAISLMQNDNQQALTYAQKSAELDPTYAWAYNDMGLALLALGKKQEGIVQLQKAVQLAPENQTIKDNLTKALQTN